MLCSLGQANEDGSDSLRDKLSSGRTFSRHQAAVDVLIESMANLGTDVEFLPCPRLLRRGPSGKDTRTPDLTVRVTGVIFLVEVRCMDLNTLPTEDHGALNALKLGEQIKRDDYTKFVMPRGSQFIPFIFGTNGYLGPASLAFLNRISRAVETSDRKMFCKDVLQRFSLIHSRQTSLPNIECSKKFLFFERHIKTLF